MVILMLLLCILHDNQNILMYLYPVGFRDANQNFGASDKAIKNLLAGLTNNLEALTTSLSDSFILMLPMGLQDS